MINKMIIKMKSLWTDETINKINNILMNKMAKITEMTKIIDTIIHKITIKDKEWIIIDRI
jgi:hypothetical protein